MQVIWPTQMHVDALPALCARKTCLRDRVDGMSFCAKHLKLRHNLKNNKKKTYNTENKCQIYFISSGDTVKIGKSRNVKMRFNALRLSSPTGLMLEAVFDGYDQIEFALHRLFEKDRLHGEWFKRTKELENIIAYAKSNDLRSIEFSCRSSFVHAGISFP